MSTGDSPTTAFAVIRRLQTVMRAPLSLEIFSTKLPPATGQSVRCYFLSRSGKDGALLWQGFLNGARHPQGPKGAVLLRGHCFMWGFSQDYQGQWQVHVDVPFIPLLENVPWRGSKLEHRPPARWRLPRPIFKQYYSNFPPESSPEVAISTGGMSITD
ncbi:hypothetical protein FB451DRAFT_1237715 [Mycena latifolia]|nr:hypothetical protein FB451DRAFT_1237715 [Mycena latifolia]